MICPACGAHWPPVGHPTYCTCGERLDSRLTDEELARIEKERKRLLRSMDVPVLGPIRTFIAHDVFRLIGDLRASRTEVADQWLRASRAEAEVRSWEERTGWNSDEPNPLTAQQEREPT